MRWVNAGTRSGFEFELGYRISPRMTLAMSAGRTEFGSTIGYKDTPEPNDFGSYWSLEASIRQVSPALVYRLGGIRTSLGPSLVQVRTWSASGRRDLQDAVRIGATAGVAFSQKVWGALNLELRARYRFVGSEDVGPFEFSNGTLPRFQASFSHWQIGFGLGLHFGRKAF